MAKRKRGGYQPARGLGIITDHPARVNSTPLNADSRMAAALRNEAQFLRTIGYPAKADAIEGAVASIGLASSERILKDLRT